MLSLVLLVSCHKEKRGPTEVDYGEVEYVVYKDDSPLSFEYLSCFKETEMEDEDAFVTYTSDRKGVMTYKAYDPAKDSANKNKPGYEIPSKRYAEIAAFTREEAENYIRIALGMISSQDAEYTVDEFVFETLEDGSVKLYMDATAEYEKTGEIQKLWMLKIVLPDDHVYTIQAFAPASIVTKYGPAFKNAVIAD